MGKAIPLFKRNFVFVRARDDEFVYVFKVFDGEPGDLDGPYPELFRTVKINKDEDK